MAPSTPLDRKRVPARRPTCPDWGGKRRSSESRAQALHLNVTNGATRAKRFKYRNNGYSSFKSDSLAVVLGQCSDSGRGPSGKHIPLSSDAPNSESHLQSFSIIHNLWSMYAKALVCLMFSLMSSPHSPLKSWMVFTTSGSLLKPLSRFG